MRRNARALQLAVGVRFRRQLLEVDKRYIERAPSHQSQRAVQRVGDLQRRRPRVTAADEGSREGLHAGRALLLRWTNRLNGTTDFSGEQSWGRYCIRAVAERAPPHGREENPHACAPRSSEQRRRQQCRLESSLGAPSLSCAAP